MTFSFTIMGKLPNLNEYVDKCRRNAYEGAKVKGRAQALCMSYIRSQLHGVHVEKPVVIHYRWYEPNRRRDLDNIAAFGHKVIQDALVQCKVLHDDGWKNVCGFTDEFYVDRDKPRIVIEIEEREDEQEREKKSGRRNKKAARTGNGD